MNGEAQSPATEVSLASRGDFRAALAGFVLMWLGALFYNGGYDIAEQFLICAGLLVWIAACATPGQPLRLPVDALSLLLLAELAWLVQSVAGSLLPPNSTETAITLALLPLGYFATRAALAAYPAFWAAARQALGWLGGGVLALAIVEFIATRDRPTSTFADANVLAGFANALFFPAWAVVLGRWQRAGDRAALLSAEALLALLALAALFVTTSLGGLLCFVAAWLAFTAVAARRGWPAGRAAGLVLLASATFYLGVYQWQAQRPAPLSRIAAELRTGGEATIADGGFLRERLAMARACWQIWRDHGWAGTGVGTFKVLYPAYRTPEDATTGGNLAHNDYAQALMEGGPPLLAMLLAPLVAVLGWLLAALRRGAADGAAPASAHGADAPEPGESDRDAAERLGIACALLAIALHAVPNFIYYTGQMSLLAGIGLGRLRGGAVAGRSVALGGWLGSRALLMALAASGALLLGTLGLRALFMAVNGRCQLHVCQSLARDPRFMAGFANFMAATQPSWIPARDYLVATWDASARAAQKPEDRTALYREEAREIGSIVADYPLAYIGYRKLADLLVAHPEAAEAVPDGVPRTPEALYAETLRWVPYDAGAAVALSRLREQAGDPRAALEPLVGVSPHWKIALLTDADRLAMLKQGLPLAVQLGRCRLAHDLAERLAGAAPDNAFAQAVRQALPEQPGEAADAPGCGVPASALPAPIAPPAAAKS